MPFPKNPRATLLKYPLFRKNTDGSISDLTGEFDEYRNKYWKDRADKIKNGHH